MPLPCLIPGVQRQKLVKFGVAAFLSSLDPLKQMAEHYGAGNGASEAGFGGASEGSHSP